jgi:hypothetical protein
MKTGELALSVRDVAMTVWAMGDGVAGAGGG